MSHEALFFVQNLFTEHIFDSKAMLVSESSCTSLSLAHPLYEQIASTTETAKFKKKRKYLTKKH